MVVVAAVVSLGSGLALGLLLGSQRRAADLATARAGAERSVELERALDVQRARAADAGGQLEKVRAELAAAERRHADASASSTRCGERAEELQAEAQRLAEARARLAAELDAERRAVAARAAEAERTKESVRAEIEKLAGRLLEEKGKAILERSQEGLKALLGPVGERLKAFEDEDRADLPRGEPRPREPPARAEAAAGGAGHALEAGRRPLPRAHGGLEGAGRLGRARPRAGARDGRPHRGAGVRPPGLARGRGGRAEAAGRARLPPGRPRDRRGREVLAHRVRRGDAGRTTPPSARRRSIATSRRCART